MITPKEYYRDGWEPFLAPDERVFALIYTDEYKYQIAQYEPATKQWMFYYLNTMFTIPCTNVAWHKLPRVYHKSNDSYLEKVYALEERNVSF